MSEGFLCVYPFPDDVPVNIEPESVSHVGRDQYAVDFLVPEGTSVCAPRSGIVQEVKDDSDVGGPDRKFEHDANYVIIGHLGKRETRESIRFFGRVNPVNSIIIHLQRGSVTVKAGDWVEEGQVIARQGSTGWTYTPHIHIAAYQNGITIPIQFKPRGGS